MTKITYVVFYKYDRSTKGYFKKVFNNRWELSDFLFSYRGSIIKSFTLYEEV